MSENSLSKSIYATCQRCCERNEKRKTYTAQVPSHASECVPGLVKAAFGDKPSRRLRKEELQANE